MSSKINVYYGTNKNYFIVNCDTKIRKNLTPIYELDLLL